MSKGKTSTKVLIVDDEREYSTWLTDFFEHLGLAQVYAATADEALTVLANDEFRLLIVDMNIPASPSLLASTTPTVMKYPGLLVAQKARNLMYGAHSVIAYTVHDDEALAAELDKLYCRYVLKGRIRVIKAVINKSLAEAPSKNT